MNNDYKFSEISASLLKSLKEKDLDLGEPCYLFEGIFETIFCKEIKKSAPFAGPTVPMIALIGEKTGRVHFFALKAILKDEQ